MQAFYTADFEREYGCSEAEWLRWLPDALGDRSAAAQPGALHLRIDEGSLDLSWQVLPPREIALVRLPRLAVRFRFDRVGDDRRFAFMRRFDLYMLRGGG